MTALKLLQPTHVGACTRFVCWNAITTVRTIGYQENAPKMRSSGSMKANVESPPLRTHERGVRRTRYRRSTSAAPSTSSSLIAFTQPPSALVGGGIAPAPHVLPPT